MKAIKLLDSLTINKIAAGEVVESPQSVVKELVENSIDAGATSVTVEVKEGGTSYIRIADNGWGILSAEVQTAFLRHATSKIAEIEDLEQALTLGFRGEALASIAAVAQVEITTRHKDEELGTNLSIHAGDIQPCGQDGITRLAAAQGTTIVVKNLFYNVPARKKFMKKSGVESGRISDVMNRIALGHPNISFQYINNETIVLHTVGSNDPKATVLYVYGKDAAEKMIPIHYQQDNFLLTGLIGKPELTRANRNYENLFINGRFIKNSLICSAVEEGYKTRLMIGKFPLFVLHFQLPPNMVDANVHPAKLEVRFRNDDEIYRFFNIAIQKAFDGQVLIPKVSWDKPESPKLMPEKMNTVNTVNTVNTDPAVHLQTKKTKSIKELLEGPTVTNHVQEPRVEYHSQESRRQSFEDLPNEVAQKAKPVQYDLSQKTVPNEIESLISLEEAQREGEEAGKAFEPFFKHYKIIGQLFQTYWIVEQGKSMYIIDQHAAHERVLYEEILNRLKQEAVTAQQLLSPVLLHMTEAEKALYTENKELFAKFGFAVETFPDNTYALKSVPYILKEPVNASFFMEVLDILSIEGPIEELLDIKTNAIASIACKAAVKGHDRLDIQEAQALMGQLLKLENPFQCPHGRPTIIEMPIYELEKKFKRIQD